MTILFLLLCLTVNDADSAVNPIYFFDPEKVELSGALDLQTFPELPNYESVATGDHPTRYFFLRLRKPIDVQTKLGSSDESNESERNVRILQLSIDAEDKLLWQRFRGAGKGAGVTIRGVLFHRLSGHNHSRVLMIVDKDGFRKN